jgi:thiamine biosynthesis lipoprotein
MLNNFTQSKVALGSDIDLTLVCNDIELAEKTFKILWEEISAFENRFSRFINSSELSKFNNLAGTKQYVSVEFIELLKLSKKYSSLTDGLFNPFVLPALQAAGYKESFIENKEVLADYSDRSFATYDNIKIGDDWAMIPYGTAIDFGGIGKGYLADKLSTITDDVVLNGYWLSIGGDIIAKGKDSNDSFWNIEVQSALNPEKNIARIKLKNADKIGVATSGVIKRKGKYNGKDWHHIIDPGTQSPVLTDILVTTVCLPSALEADIYAKCLVISGLKEFDRFSKNHKIYSSLVQYKNNKSDLIFKINGNLIELI